MAMQASKKLISLLSFDSSRLHSRQPQNTLMMLSGVLALLCFTSWPVFAQTVKQTLAKNPPASTLSYEILSVEEHDARSFTQGWEISGGFIYESSGGYGKSFIRKSQHPSNKVVLEKRLPGNWFAEGLTLIDDRLYLLSWRQQKGLLLDSKDLKPLAQFRYSGEGWGLCHMNNEIYMSNGSDSIQVFNSRFELQRRLPLSKNNKKRRDGRWSNLNELECAKGLVWANLWQEKRIVAFDPVSGNVQYQLDLSAISPDTQSTDAVLNGIAYDQQTDGFWVTGKLWPKRYLLKLDLHREHPRATQSAD